MTLKLSTHRMKVFIVKDQHLCFLLISHLLHNMIMYEKNLLFTKFLGFGAKLEKWYLFLLSRLDIMRTE